MSKIKENSGKKPFLLKTDSNREFESNWFLKFGLIPSPKGDNAAREVCVTVIYHFKLYFLAIFVLTINELN